MPKLNRTEQVIKSLRFLRCSLVALHDKLKLAENLRQEFDALPNNLTILECEQFTDRYSELDLPFAFDGDAFVLDANVVVFALFELVDCGLDTDETYSDRYLAEGINRSVPYTKLSAKEQGQFFEIFDNLFRDTYLDILMLETTRPISCEKPIKSLSSSIEGCIDFVDLKLQKKLSQKTTTPKDLSNE